MGYIEKAVEEISFNDFYSNGNENILRYSGVLAGLKEQKHIFFDSLPIELSSKLEKIESVSEKLIKEHEDNRVTFEMYKLGAEFCLYTYIDDSLRFMKLNNKFLFVNIINKVRRLQSKNNQGPKDVIELKKMIDIAETIINNIKEADEKLNSITFLKKNALYATKNFAWLHEKGIFDNMTIKEIKMYYAKNIRNEVKQKMQMMNNDEIGISSKENIGIA